MSIENDLQDRGIDLAAGLLDTRTWRWLSTRIAGLLNADSRTARALGTYPPPDPERG